MPGGNLARSPRYKKTARVPRSSHARHYYTRSLIIEPSSRRYNPPILRCLSAPKVMDSSSRSASPRENSRPQHRPPSPPTPPGVDNRAFQPDEDPNHNESFTSNSPAQNGVNGHSKEPNGHTDTKVPEAVNLELINLSPKNGNKKDVEVDMRGSNPYDEYFVPVNEHRKYMRGEKLYVTADKRGEKNGCKRPLCWTLLALILAAVVAVIILAATGILFASTPTPVDEYNGTLSSARALGGVLSDHHDHSHHDHSHDHAVSDGPWTQNDGAVDSNESGDSSLYVPRTIEGDLKIDNKEFIQSLADPESDDYHEFTSNFAEKLKRTLFDRATLENGNHDITLEIVKLEKGSIVVTYRISWKPKKDTPADDSLITIKSVRDRLNEYLNKNSRIIDVYHIAEDKTSIRYVLDLCQINKNDCDYGCMFDDTALEFACTCPTGEIADLNNPKKCISILEATNQDTSQKEFRLLDNAPETILKQVPHEEQPGTESVHIADQPQNTYDWKDTQPPKPEIATTETDSIINYSHVFGHDRDDKTEAPKPEPKPEPNTDSPLAEPVPEPTSEPEPVAEPKAEPEPTSEPKAEPEPTAEPKAESEPTAEPQAEPEPTAKPQAEPEPTAELQAEPEPTAEPQIEPEPTAEPKPEPEPKAESEPTSELESVAKPKPKHKNAAIDPLPVAEPEPTPQPEPTPKSKAEPESSKEGSETLSYENIGSFMSETKPVEEYSTTERQVQRFEENHDRKSIWKIMSEASETSQESAENKYADNGKPKAGPKPEPGSSKEASSSEQDDKSSEENQNKSNTEVRITENYQGLNNYGMETMTTTTVAPAKISIAESNLYSAQTVPPMVTAVVDENRRVNKQSNQLLTSESKNSAENDWLSNDTQATEKSISEETHSEENKSPKPDTRYMDLIRENMNNAGTHETQQRSSKPIDLEDETKFLVIPVVNPQNKGEYNDENKFDEAKVNKNVVKSTNEEENKEEYKLDEVKLNKHVDISRNEEYNKEKHKIDEVKVNKDVDSSTHNNEYEFVSFQHLSKKANETISNFEQPLVTTTTASDSILQISSTETSMAENNTNTNDFNPNNTADSSNTDKSNTSENQQSKNMNSFISDVESMDAVVNETNSVTLFSTVTTNAETEPVAPTTSADTGPITTSTSIVAEPVTTITSADTEPVTAIPSSDTEPVTKYSIQNQYQPGVDMFLAEALDTRSTEPPSSYTTEKQVADEDLDITFDALNMLYNRSSKSFMSQNKTTIEVESEKLETTTEPDWLMEAVTEVNYQPIANIENEQSTETPIATIEDAMHGFKDDFEPDYINTFGLTKLPESEQPVYSMVHDYDNEDSRVKKASTVVPAPITYIKPTVEVTTSTEKANEITTSTKIIASDEHKTASDKSLSEIIGSDDKSETHETTMTDMDNVMNGNQNDSSVETAHVSKPEASTTAFEGDKYGTSDENSKPDNIVTSVNQNATTTSSSSKSSPIEITTVHQYVYQSSEKTDNDQRVIPQNSSSEVFLSKTKSALASDPAPVWEEHEKEPISRYLPESPSSDLLATNNHFESTVTATSTTTNFSVSSSQKTPSGPHDTSQPQNTTHLSNLNVTIYEISSHNNNHSLSSSNSSSTHSHEYEDHETEMNPFLPEVENNKSLVKKLQEGHDLEIPATNETQNENTEEHNNNTVDSKVENKETIAISRDSDNTFPEFNNDGTSLIQEMLTNDPKFNFTPEEKASVPAPAQTFLQDTDDLAHTTSTELSTKSGDTNSKAPADIDGDYLSVVPIEEEKVLEEKELQNIHKKNYKSENSHELNDISDSPKKSDRRTLGANKL